MAAGMEEDMMKRCLAVQENLLKMSRNCEKLTDHIKQAQEDVNELMSQAKPMKSSSARPISWDGAPSTLVRQVVVPEQPSHDRRQLPVRG